MPGYLRCSAKHGSAEPNVCNEPELEALRLTSSGPRCRRARRGAPARRSCTAGSRPSCGGPAQHNSCLSERGSCRRAEQAGDAGASSAPADRRRERLPAAASGSAAHRIDAGDAGADDHDVNFLHVEDWRAAARMTRGARPAKESEQLLSAPPLTQQQLLLQCRPTWLWTAVRERCRGRGSVGTSPEPPDAARTNTAGAPRAGKPAQPDAVLRPAQRRWRRGAAQVGRRPWVRVTKSSRHRKMPTWLRGLVV